MNIKFITEALVRCFIKPYNSDEIDKPRSIKAAKGKRDKIGTYLGQSCFFVPFLLCSFYEPRDKNSAAASTLAEYGINPFRRYQLQLATMLVS